MFYPHGSGAIVEYYKSQQLSEYVRAPCTKAVPFSSLIRWNSWFWGPILRWGDLSWRAAIPLSLIDIKLRKANRKKWLALLPIMKNYCVLPWYNLDTCSVYVRIEDFGLKPIHHVGIFGSSYKEVNVGILMYLTGHLVFSFSPFLHFLALKVYFLFVCSQSRYELLCRCF